MKLNDVINLNSSFIGLKDTTLPFKLNYAIAKNSRVIDPVIQAFYIARDGILKNHGGTQPSAESWNIPNENVEKVNKALADLANEDVDINLHKVPVDLIENISTTPAILSGLMVMVDDSEH